MTKIIDEMTYKEANLRYLKVYLEENNLKQIGNNSMMCPHPLHDNTDTPAASYKEDLESGDCYVHCFNNVDHPERNTFRLADIIGFEFDLKDYRDQLKKIEELFSIKIADLDDPMSSISSSKEEHCIEKSNLDFKSFFEEKNKQLNTENNPGAEYLATRGISLETANRFKVGYDPAWRSPKALEQGKKPPESRRIIIPTSQNSYLARCIDNLPDHAFEKMKEGGNHFLNLEILNDFKRQQSVFIVEGEIDCLSIIEAGGEAISLGGIENIKTFIDALRSHKSLNFPLIALLDTDDAGKKAQSELIDSIKSNFSEINIIDGSAALSSYKDANDFLKKDRDRFIEIVKKYTRDGVSAQQDIIRKEKSASGSTRAFLKKLKDNYYNTPISTGFSELDHLLDGGLRPGLIVIAAMSSLGKTTLIHQIADYISANNNIDVLYFTIEMSRFDLISRSISRQLYLSDSYEITSNEIKNPHCWSNFDSKKQKAIISAFKKYESKSKNLFLIEDRLEINISPESIRNYIKDHIKNFPGRRIVCILDYLQIMDCDDDQRNRTDKQKIDDNSKKIRQIVRDFDIPFIVISSLNRMAYNKRVTQAALKESGAVEYSADIVLGLNLEKLVNGNFDDLNMLKADAMQEVPRRIELQIIKNRDGNVYDACNLNYFAAYNSFME